MAQRNLSRPVSRVGADERPRTRWTREERPLTRGLAEDRPSIPDGSAAMRRGSAATTSGDDTASSRPISRRGAQEINRVILIMIKASHINILNNTKKVSSCAVYILPLKEAKNSNKEN
jgi:hypothetical protein